MGKPLSYAVREKIISLKEQGKSFKQISQVLCCSESGVKKIWYNYQKYGSKALDTDYSRCGRPSPYDKSIHIIIDKIRDNQQGATYVYSKLAKDYSELRIPHARTISRWWKKEKTNRKRGRPQSIEKKDGLKKLIILGK